jgi:(p)ppGpp synthase/HD superfamily hydrolase
MENTSEQINKIELAKEFATKKFAEAGMDNHFLDVYQILQDDFGVEDQNILAAALLHDALEDTNTTYEELEQIFGKEIADMVDEVSHPKNYNDEQRKEYHEKLKHISPGAKLVKLADFASHLKPGPYLVKHPNYIATIKDFLETCSDSKAKETTTALAAENERPLTVLE